MSAATTLAGIHLNRQVGLTATQVAQRAGITYRQLDFWIRAGLLDIRAHGRGHDRAFTRADVARLADLGHLVRFGLSPRRAAEILDSSTDPIVRFEAGPIVLTLTRTAA